MDAGARVARLHDAPGRRRALRVRARRRRSCRGSRSHPPDATAPDPAQLAPILDAGDRHRRRERLLAPPEPRGLPRRRRRRSATPGPASCCTTTTCRGSARRPRASPTSRPRPPGALHVTINARSRAELAARGIDAVEITNAFDVDAPAGTGGTRRAARSASRTTRSSCSSPRGRSPARTSPPRSRFAEALAALVAPRPVRFWLTGPAEDGYQAELDELLPRAPGAGHARARPEPGGRLRRRRRRRVPVDRRRVRQPGDRIRHRPPAARRRALPRPRRDPRPRLRALRARRTRGGGEAPRRPGPGPPRPQPGPRPAALRARRPPGPDRPRRSATTDGRRGERRRTRPTRSPRSGPASGAGSGWPSGSATSGCSSRSSASSSAWSPASPTWSVAVSIGGLVVGIVVLPLPDHPRVRHPGRRARGAGRRPVSLTARSRVRLRPTARFRGGTAMPKAAVATAVGKPLEIMDLDLADAEGR